MSSVKFFLPTLPELISRESVFLHWEKSWGFWSFEEIKKTISAADTILVIAEIDGNLIGIAFWSVSDDTAELLYVFVSSEYRGQKIGEQLLDFSYKCLVERRVKEGFLEVRPSNSKALFLYQKQGFLEISRRKSYYPDGEDCLVMRKDLL